MVLRAQGFHLANIHWHMHGLLLSIICGLGIGIIIFICCVLTVIARLLVLIHDSQLVLINRVTHCRHLLHGIRIRGGAEARYAISSAEELKTIRELLKPQFYHTLKIPRPLND